ncbi:hypothetical protein CHR37_10630 [Bacillus velezensis]|nr:hypothetical protein CFN60_13765 [Bacillus velezensis]ATV23759.1 hypothetical protein CS547_13825 [Bacillus sp. Lzh-5]MBU0444148.1 hypothetical protein [Bacillus amyloliquefaciens]AUG36946.1 hypothetical protein CXP43_14835 [Bacillus velezensis]MCK6100462.1 hypothetical protein [Bacillus velezensis]
MALAHFVSQTNAIYIIPMNEVAYHVTKNFGIDGAHGAKTAIAVIPIDEWIERLMEFMGLIPKQNLK